MIVKPLFHCHFEILRGYVALSDAIMNSDFIPIKKVYSIIYNNIHKYSVGQIYHTNYYKYCWHWCSIAQHRSQHELPAQQILQTRYTDLTQCISKQV